MRARVQPVAVPTHASCWDYCHSLLSIMQGVLHHFMKSHPLHGISLAPFTPPPSLSWEEEL